MHTATLSRLSEPNTTDPYEIKFSPIQEISPSQSKGAFSIAPPGLGPGNNIFLGISGQTNDIVLDTYLYNDGTDKSNGTAPDDDVLNGEAVTLQEQYYYLKNYIHAPTFSARWDFVDSQGYHVNPDNNDVNGIEVFFEDFDVATISEDNEGWKPLRLGLREGRTVG